MKYVDLKNLLVFATLVLMLFTCLGNPPVFAKNRNASEANDSDTNGRQIKPANWKDRINAGEIVYYCSDDSPAIDEMTPYPLRPEWPSGILIPEWSFDEKKRRGFPEKDLKALLSNEKENTTIPNQGIRLHGYAFNDGLNLSNMKLNRHLSFTGCYFEKDVNLSGIIAPYGISFKNSYFKGCLNLKYADITGFLNMDGTTCSKVDAEGMKVNGSVSIKNAMWKEAKGKDEKDTFAVNFQGTRIDGQIVLDESVFNGDVRMFGIYAENQITAEKSQFLGNLCMQGAIIKKRLSLKGTTIKKSFFCQGGKLGGKTFLGKSHIVGKLDMTGVYADGGIDMQEAVLTDLALTDAKIIGPLEMQNLKVNNIDAKGMAVEGSVFLNNVRLNAPCQTNCSGKAEFQCAMINGQLILDGAFFNGEVDLHGILIQSQLQAEKNVKFNGNVNLHGAKIKRRISLTGAEIQKDLNFQGAEIGAMLFLKKSNIAGKLNMTGTIVEGDIDMGYGKFKDIDFITTNVNGQLLMNDCSISGEFKSYGIKVKDIWEFQRSICMGNTHMHRSCTGSKLDLRDSKFFKDISLKGAHIGSDLFIDNVEFKSLVDMELITIDGAFIINNVIFSSETDSHFKLNLAQINFINYKNVNGLKCLDLSLTNVGRMIIEVRESSDWPDDMDLRGFTYKQIQGKYTGTEARREEFFKSWLQQLKQYSPQPFEQCARVLRQEGHFVKANEVLFVGKQAEREKSFQDGNYLRWIGLSLLLITIGYGIGLKYFFAGLWVLFFVFIGTCFCYRFRQKGNWEKLWDSENNFMKTISYLVLYNLDMILPVVTLRERHKEIELPFFLIIYFSFHKLVGWILASFIIAGLTGITQG